jgi:hypothetical protein
MAIMPMSDAIEAGCKLIGWSPLDWWFTRPDSKGTEYLMLFDDDPPATGADVLATAVVGRAGSVAKAMSLLFGAWKRKERAFVEKAWPFLKDRTTLTCPTPAKCFPSGTVSDGWTWYHDIEHMSSRPHRVSREELAARLRAAGH